ncbi:hypothetical protein [Nocardia sp. NPDC059691]|uniref:hypothetical protein n=1 Tax=unclassified Nocardia TaxID=2637762 RepID=UPI0036B1DE15
MKISEGVVDMIARTAGATTAAAGAVGGAAVNGVIGGIQGAAIGVKKGLGSGSHSTPAAALTLVAIGATGLVDWPVLLGVGGATLVVQKLGQRSGRLPPPEAGDRAGRPEPHAQSGQSARRDDERAIPAPESAGRAQRSPSMH